MKGTLGEVMLIPGFPMILLLFLGGNGCGATFCWHRKYLKIDDIWLFALFLRASFKELYGWSRCLKT